MFVEVECARDVRRITLLDYSRTFNPIYLIHCGGYEIQ